MGTWSPYPELVDIQASDRAEAPGHALMISAPNRAAPPPACLGPSAASARSFQGLSQGMVVTGRCAGEGLERVRAGRAGRVQEWSYLAGSVDESTRLTGERESRKRSSERRTVDGRTSFLQGTTLQRLRVLQASRNYLISRNASSRWPR